MLSNAVVRPHSTVWPTLGATNAPALVVTAQALYWSALFYAHVVLLVKDFFKKKTHVNHNIDIISVFT